MWIFVTYISGFITDVSECEGNKVSSQHSTQREIIHEKSRRKGFIVKGETLSFLKLFPIKSILVTATLNPPMLPLLKFAELSEV